MYHWYGRLISFSNLFLGIQFYTQGIHIFFLGSFKKFWVLKFKDFYRECWHWTNKFKVSFLPFIFGRLMKFSNLSLMIHHNWDVLLTFSKSFQINKILRKKWSQFQDYMYLPTLQCESALFFGMPLSVAFSPRFVPCWNYQEEPFYLEFFALSDIQYKDI